LIRSKKEYQAPCFREIYRGPKAFSEPESRAIANFMKTHLSQLRGYVALHAYENSILVPYGYSVKARPINYPELVYVAKSMVNEMNARYGNNYTVIKSSTLCMFFPLQKRFPQLNSYSLDPASGCSDDYAKSLGIKYTYTIELTTGFYRHKYVGFETPKAAIAQTSDELRAGIVHLIKVVAAQP
jgi:hypothetical protein